MRDQWPNDEGKQQQSTPPLSLSNPLTLRTVPALLGPFVDMSDSTTSTRTISASRTKYRMSSKSPRRRGDTRTTRCTGHGGAVVRGVGSPDVRGEENITVVWFYSTVRPRRETDQCGGDVVLLAQLMPSCAWRCFRCCSFPWFCL